MKTDTAEGYINELDIDRFKKNQDYLMKLVEEDYKLIAWISWGLDLLFRDYTYEQMKDFIGQVEVEELKKSIIPVDIKIYIEDTKGVIFDKQFELRKDGETLCLLGIENHISLDPVEEIQAQGFFYVLSLAYWEAKRILENKVNYRQIKPAYALWILPEASKERENEIIDSPIKLFNEAREYNFNAGASSIGPEIIKFEPDSHLYQYYLGGQFDIDSNILKKADRKDKLTCLLLLLDILFGFDIEKDKRLELAGELFNLKGRIIEGEVEVMNVVENLIAVGEAKERKQNISLLASYLITQSGNTLTKEEADKKAEEILTKPGEK